MPKSSKLSEKIIVLTRQPEDNKILRERLEKHAARVLELPLIEIDFADDPDAADIQEEVLETFGEYEWLVFTSVHGVRGFFQRFFKRFRDIRCIGGCRIACVGPATANAVAEFHLEVDFVPETHTGDALAAALMQNFDIENEKICVVTGNRNRDSLIKKLRDDGGAIVDAFPCYATNACDLATHPAAREFRETGAHAIVFASPSAVQSFIDQARILQISAGGVRPKVVAIGEITAAELRKKTVPVDAIAARATADGIFEALENLF